MSDKKPYDSTIARIAGNIAAGIAGHYEYIELDAGTSDAIADHAVDLAQRIVRRLAAPAVWYSMETAPKDGRRLLLCWRHPDCDVDGRISYGVDVAFWAERRWHTTHGGIVASQPPTHWTHIPEPPSTKEPR